VVAGGGRCWSGVFWCCVQGLTRLVGGGSNPANVKRDKMQDETQKRTQSYLFPAISSRVSDNIMTEENTLPIPPYDR